VIDDFCEIVNEKKKESGSPQAIYEKCKEIGSSCMDKAKKLCTEVSGGDAKRSMALGDDSSGGSIGIIIGCIVILALVVGVFVYCCFCKGGSCDKRTTKGSRSGLKSKRGGGSKSSKRVKSQKSKVGSKRSSKLRSSKSRKSRGSRLGSKKLSSNKSSSRSIKSKRGSNKKSVRK